VYLINFLNLQTAQQLFIAVGRYRTGQWLIGIKDGVNTTYTTPGLEKFTHNLPFLSIQVYYNGVRQTLLDDYSISESAGPGTGYDTVTFLEIAPKANDKLLVDYVVAAP
jgi:hypothetical protein